jgi:3'-phosphoadenosine 5'-phosphosulfate (PAPS) 3'-phosphatase
MGSSLKFCLVAEGSADIYLRDVPTMEWDTAAAQCVVEARRKNVHARRSAAPLRQARSEKPCDHHGRRSRIGVVKNARRATLIRVTSHANMGRHIMKTTIEIADDPFRNALKT